MLHWSPAEYVGHGKKQTNAYGSHIRENSVLHLIPPVTSCGCWSDSASACCNCKKFVLGVGVCSSTGHRHYSPYAPRVRHAPHCSSAFAGRIARDVCFLRFLETLSRGGIARSGPDS